MPANRLQFALPLRRSPWRTLLPAILLIVAATALPAPAASALSPGSSGFSAAAPQATAASQKPNDSAPLARGKKLILTDGSYQLVREYQREGDRVRYYSVERSAWEEIPANLVDWPATEQAEAQQEAAKKALVKKLQAADLAARLAGLDSDKSYEAEPGVILPDATGLYAIADGQVRAMDQDLAVSRADKARAVERIASGVPMIPTKATIEIRPKHAKLRIRAGEVAFYFRTPDGRDPKLELLKADVESDRRKLNTVSTNFGGENKYKGNQIPLMSEEAAHGLYRFTLDQNLMPGEYALVELTSVGDMDLSVWDFGVDMLSGNAGAFLYKVAAK